MCSLPMRREAAEQQCSHLVHCDIAENMSDEGLYLCGCESQNGFAHTIMTLTSEVPVLLQNCNFGMCKEQEVRTRCASAVAAWSA